MEAKSVVKVGVLVLIGFLVLVGGYAYLRHYNPDTYTVKVTFTDTLGLLRQSPVRMQGVQIGEVASVDLDTYQPKPLPVVTIAIKDQYRIPRGSEFVIKSGVLITNPQLEIVPSDSPASLAKDGTAVVQGAPPAGALAQFSPDLEKAVVKLNSSFDNLNGKFNQAYAKIDRILDQTNKAMVTANETANAAKGIIADPEVKVSLLATVHNFRKISEDAQVSSHELTADLRDIVRKSKAPLEDLPVKLTDVLTRIDGTIDDANEIVKKLTEQVTDPRFQESLQETADLARTTLARFNQIASDLHQVTGDPTLQSNLKGTVANLQDTTARADQVVEKIDSLLGKITGPGGTMKTPRVRFPRVNFVGSVSEQFDPDRLRVDVDARVPFGKRDLLDVGFYDLGESNRFNLQAGTYLSNSLLARYGFYASKLGVGLEYEPVKGTGIRADLWDTVHTRLDARGFYRVNSDASIWAGADNLFQHPVPIIGVQFEH